MKQRLVAALILAFSLAALSVVETGSAVAKPQQPTAPASFNFVSDMNNLCLDVAGGNTGSGAAVYMYFCNGG